jgi:protein-disulfide isomerase
LLLCVTIAAYTRTSAQGRAPAQGSGAQAPASQLSPAAASMLQQRAEEYLRNLYAWGLEFEVKVAAPKPTAVPDLYEMTVEVSLKGQSDSAVVYLTRDGRYMLRGELSDMNADPFAAVREKLVFDGSPSKGPANAPVVIVEFGDFQCPSCRQLETVLRRLLSEYPQVRLVFKDFPLEQIHPWAMTAALVGRCAYQQSPDAFWKVHDLIYDNQERITAETAYDKLLELGVDAGLDSSALRTCVADPKTAEAVRKSIAEGSSLGVNGTPTTFVNGREVVGPNEALLRQYITFAVK